MDNTGVAMTSTVKLDQEAKYDKQTMDGMDHGDCRHGRFMGFDGMG
jgi:hypothetical protein